MNLKSIFSIDAINEQDESWNEAALRVYQKKFGKTEPKSFQEKVKRQQFMRYRGFGVDRFES